jgi:hypothetical protein
VLELIEVRIVGLPVDVYREAAEHTDELMREFALMAADPGAHGDAAVPTRLLSLVEELRTRFSGFTAQPDAELNEASIRGDSTLDLFFLVPPDAARGAADLDQLLDEADAFCRSGDLLTLATPPEVVAFRRWFLREFVRQSRGEPPVPWSGG